MPSGFDTDWTTLSFNAPITEISSSGGGHQGPTLYISGSVLLPGWKPTFVGESLTWSGTSTTSLPQGDLYWSSIIVGGGAETVSFELATQSNSGIPILIDIKPGSSPNSVNLKSKGLLPVAILGTDVFDVNDVDISTLLFSGTPLIPVRSAIEDVNVDGFEDLSLKFSVADLVESGALGFDTIEGLLTGELFDGTSFEGMDSIRIVPPSFSSAPLIAAVPEPTTCVLALAALCLAMSRRRSF